MDGLKATLECIYQVNINLGLYDEDIFIIEKGEKIGCKICNDGIRFEISKNCYSINFKPSKLMKYFKVAQ